jgi:multicomponent Na+:H+ antiporter subunit G
VTELLTAALVVTAAGFLLLAALGLLRMPDLYTRLGAATKAVALGGGLMFVAVAVHFGDVASDARAIAGVAFLFVTAPVTAHVIARAAYHLGIGFVPDTIRLEDEGDLAGPRSRTPQAQGEPATD